MNDIEKAIGGIMIAIIGLAIIAVLVSKQSQTGTVLQAGGTAFAQIIGAAVAPVTGNAGLSGTGNLLGSSPGNLVN